MDSTNLETDIKITEEDVLELLHLFTKVPSLILKGVVARRSNVVKSFEGKILEYKEQLSEDELAKIRVVLEMPTSELQKILHNAYEKTGKKQLKILSEKNAEPFIEKNLDALEKILFNA
ncbi:hypothetical protein Metbo_1830 [Methanobacterium lacus]|uniref:Uncharacterized protein n=1 Tax=Methanobacterium lacus (strain AL-21) TaxID=877455 RepID=F0TAI0_METLA|nr:hypothetical protein [Methanobacterium lacus]ADZ10052.1 hypothetical protein Metbo_1830 [Methanobacterium lacus]